MKWTTKTVFILSLIGSAVGLGNIWRFPYIAKDEGIWFIFFYLLFVFTLGVGGVYLEIFAGANEKLPLIKTAKKYLGNKKIALLFYLPFIVSLTILSYYSVITGWTIGYLITPFSFTGIRGSLLSLTLTLFVNTAAVVILRMGLHKGLERVNKYFVSLLFILILMLFFLSRPWLYKEQIIKILDKPFSLSTIFSSLTQALFSLSIGMAALYTYSMFAEKKYIRTASFFTVVGDTAIALISLFLLLSLHFQFSSSPKAEEFTFSVLERYFSSSLYHSIFGKAFFLLLFLAAFTSLISFYSTLHFNLSRIWIYLAVVFSAFVSLENFIGLNLISLLDRRVVEILLPLSLIITFSLYIKIWRKRGATTLKHESN